MPLDVVLPLRAWWLDGVWRQGWLGLFVAAALLPFILLHALGASDISSAAWGFSVYFGLMWLVAMRALIRPEPVDWRVLAGVAVFTAVAGVAIAVSLERAIVTNGLTSNPFALTFGVGLPEETVKALPVFLFLFLPARYHSPRTFLYLGVVSGLAFGAAEAVAYSSAYAGQLPFLSSDATGQYTVLVIWRLVTDSLLHACMAGIAAYFIGLAATYRKAALPLIGVGLALSAVLHGVYDATASNWGGAAVAAAIVFVFAGYVYSGDRISERLATIIAAEAVRSP